MPRIKGRKGGTRFGLPLEGGSLGNSEKRAAQILTHGGRCVRTESGHTSQSIVDII